MLRFFLLFILILLSSCRLQGSIPEGIGRTIRNSSGALNEAVDQTKAAVELGKIGVERAKEGLQEAQETAADLAERARKAQEGSRLLKEAVAGSGSLEE